MSDVVFESLNASFGMTPKQYEKYTELMNTPSGEWPEPGKTELFGFPDGLFVRLGISRDWVVENIAMYVVKHYPDPSPAAPDSSIPQPLAELAEARERIRELEAERADVFQSHHEMCATLQKAVSDFDDGRHAGDNLDEAIVDLLRQARLRTAELEAALKSAETHIEAYRNSTHMPPSLYMMLTDVSLMIGSTLKGGDHPQP